MRLFHVLLRREHHNRTLSRGRVCAIGACVSVVHFLSRYDRYRGLGMIQHGPRFRAGYLGFSRARGPEGG
jgi:hypothetical protein